MDALGAPTPREVLQQRGGHARHRVAFGEQVLELVDHGDDPGPVPVRVLLTEFRDVGDLELLGRGRTTAQLVGEEPQQRQPELAVGVDVHAHQTGVRSRSDPADPG